MNSVNSNFKKSDNLLSVTLYDSVFLKDGEHVGKVTRNTVSLENIIADIIEEHTGLDPFVIQHAAILLQQHMLKMIRQGKSINILDLGILYICLDGVVKGNSPDSADIPDLSVRFTPSSLVKDALENIAVDKVVFSDNCPKIDIITDCWTGSVNSSLSPGRICRIEGDRLKLGDEGSSLSFIQVDENGQQLSHILPMSVPLTKFLTNTRKKLEFFIPDDLISGTKYRILVSTTFITATSSRKTPLSSISSVVTIAGNSG